MVVHHDNSYESMIIVVQILLKSQVHEYIEV